MKTEKIIMDLMVKKDILSAKDVPVFKYGVYVILYNAMILLIALLISIVCHQFYFSLMGLLFFGPVRVLLGGYHSSTKIGCVFSFQIVYIGTIYFYISFYSLNLLLVIWLIFGVISFIRINKESQPTNPVFFLVVFTYLGLTLTPIRIYIGYALFFSGVLYLFSLIFLLFPVLLVVWH